MFTRSPYIFCTARSPGDAGLETQVAMVLYVNGTAVVPGGARFRMRAGINMAVLEWVAVLAGIFHGALPHGIHLVSGHA